MSTPRYEQIAASIRTAIYNGEYSPGDELPTIREMAQQWQCAPGTVQRAYHLLTDEGLLIAGVGRGTVVRDYTQDPGGPDLLRRAELMNAIEAFLLRMLSTGYSVQEFEDALALSLDRWRTYKQQSTPQHDTHLRFAGSHDPAIAWLATHLRQQTPGLNLEILFSGSLGGLIALAEHRADLAGCHLWDTESQQYNAPFVRRLLPGQRTALLTLAQRRLGLIVQPGNPLGIENLEDLGQQSVRFINRQEGAGTRVWLDAQLQNRALSVVQIPGYSDSVQTHTEVAQAVANGEADAGLGIAAVAKAFGLGFVHLTSERYELIVPEKVWESPAVQQLYALLQTDAFRDILAAEGHDVDETGHVRWVG